MTHDPYKIFSLRLPLTLAERLEQAKALFGQGELSTGEAARRLLEQRLEQIEAAAARQRARETLLTCRAKWQGSQELTREEWTCLATYGAQAYDYVAQHARSFVDPTLLAATVQAGSALLHARQVSAPDASETEVERALRASLGRHGHPDLCSGLPDVLAALGPTPAPHLGAFASHNLEMLLRDAAGLPQIPLQATLAPSLEGLLLVAIRGCWYEEQTPLQPTGIEAASDSCFPLTPTPDDGATLALQADAMHLRGTLVLSQTPRCWLALDTYVECTDLVALLAHVQAVREPSPAVRLGGVHFLWEPPEAGTQRALFTVGRVRVVLGDADVTALAAHVQEAWARHEVQEYLTRFACIYGRI